MTTSTRPQVKYQRRTLNRLALAILAIVLGGFAQSLFRQDGIWDGVILFTIAAVTFAWALGKSSTDEVVSFPPYRGLFAGLQLQQGMLAWIGRLLLIGSLVASVIGLELFDNLTTHIGAWWYYGVSVLFLIIGTLLMTKGGRRRNVRKNQPLFHFPPHTWLLLGILLLALMLRIWQFNDLPFGVWYDEAQAGLQARRWLNDTQYKPAFYNPINVSGQFLMLYAAALHYISDSVQGIRLISVLFGVAGVWAAYLFGKALRGPTFGLIMAFFMAVMRWDINFSRIAMTGIDTPFFEFLTLYFLTRLIRHGRLRDAVFAGITIGFGLSFYTAFRLFVLALAAFVLLSVLIWRHWWARRASATWWRDQATRGVIIVLAAWIVLMPVTQFARRNPQAFSNRIEVTSIFNRRDEPILTRALRINLLKHLGMFHIEGDKNGRHNLPGEPMLDPAMGILVVLGLALAIRNLFSKQAKAAHLLFLLLIPAALAGGVFSLDFEAPQSLRTIGVLPAIAYFCAVAVAAMASEAQRMIKPYSPSVLLWPAGVAALYILGFNAHTYFIRQANDFAVWNEYSTAETLTARKMNELGPGYDFFLSPFLINHPSIRFIAGENISPITLTLPDVLPIRSDANRPAALFIHQDEQWVYDAALAMYPSGKFEAKTNEPEDPISVSIVELSTADLASVQGLSLQYWAGSEMQANQIPSRALRVDAIDIDWSTAVPLTPPFTAVWEGVLYAPIFGLYQFYLDTSGDAVLEIDGVEVVSGQGELRQAWELARGNHRIKLTVIVEDTDALGQVQLRWQAPVGPEMIVPRHAYYVDPISNNGLLGKYYNNPNFDGDPAITQIDPFLNTYYHITPLPRPYSVEWSGMLNAPATGVYGLGLWAVGEAELYVDGNLVVQTNSQQQVIETSVELNGGLHEIQVFFKDTESRSRMHLLWRPPGTADPTAIPSENLWPSLGSVRQPDAQLAEALLPFETGPMRLSHIATLDEGLKEPRDVAIGSEGHIYVADTGLGGVTVFDGDRPIGSWSQTQDGPFMEPLAIVADQRGSIWVLDSTLQWIYGFDEDGIPQVKVGGPAGQFFHPRGLSLFRRFDASDILAVANTGAGNLKLFALDGTALGSVGFFGDAPGQFNEPIDALQDQFGTYFVTEGANINRWQRIDPFGKPLNAWDLDSPVAFDGAHMAWAPDGSILMTHSGNGVIRRYGPDGSLLDEWSEIDGVNLIRPVGIFVDTSTELDTYQPTLYITDIATGQVHVFNVTILN